MSRRVIMRHKVSLFEFAQPFSLPLSQSGQHRTCSVPGSYQPRTRFGPGPGRFPRHGGGQITLMLRISASLIGCSKQDKA